VDEPEGWWPPDAPMVTCHTCHYYMVQTLIIRRQEETHVTERFSCTAERRRYLSTRIRREEMLAPDVKNANHDCKGWRQKQ